MMAVIGPAFSGATQAADPLFNQADLATVTPSATDPTLPSEGWNNFFRVVADDNAQGPADAQYIGRSGAALKNVYTIDDASAYASGLGGVFDTEATNHGVKRHTRPPPARPSARPARATSQSTGLWPPR